jgi:outer membrane protein OmpU
LQIKGAFGEVLLGSENSAGYKMTYAAPDVTLLNVNSGSLTLFAPFSGGSRGSDVFRRTLGTTYLENEGNNDSQRFTYFTPRFQGLQLGVSYARDGLQDTNVQTDEDNGDIANIFDVGANYVQSFGDFDVAVSGRWGTAETAGRADPGIWSAGLNLGYAGFKIGGSYAEQNDAGLLNGESYDAGISYETGPWGFSATWFHGQNKGNGDGDGMFALNPANGKISVGTVAERGDEEIDQYLLGVKYVLAKGVVLNGFGAYVDLRMPTAASARKMSKAS